MYDHDHDNEVVPFAQTNFRNAKVRFGIKTDDRRRHMYVVGKTGMGKTNLLRTLILRDIESGHGVGLIDPHGDFAEEILQYIPASRINDVVYFNPADIEYPMGFNVLEAVDERYKHLVAAGMMGVFKKIWPDVWSPRMEYIMNSCLLALLDYPGSTMLGINRLLVDKEFRRLVISKIKDPVVKSFWVNEYASYADKFRTEAIAPIQNKVGQFLSTTIIRNIVAQVKSSINPRDIMDTGKIFIMNLSKGRIGEDASRLLGGLLITKLQLAAMERVDMPEKERRDFYLYVDEFQNFATESFANILSEARKYRLNLLVAHQYIEQLDEKVAAAVFGNVGTMVCFRVGGADSLILEKEFEPHFMGTDLVNLAKWDVYMKLMIDGVASAPFSASTLSPESKPTGNEEKVIKVSRERYAEKRAVIEEKVNRWSGFDGAEGEDGGVEKAKHDGQGRASFSDGQERDGAPGRAGGGFGQPRGPASPQYGGGARGGERDWHGAQRREPLPTRHDDYAPQSSSEVLPAHPRREFPAPPAPQRSETPQSVIAIPHMHVGEGQSLRNAPPARREPQHLQRNDRSPNLVSRGATPSTEPKGFSTGGRDELPASRREPPRRDADRWTGAHRHPTPIPSRFSERGEDVASGPRGGSLRGVRPGERRGNPPPSSVRQPHVHVSSISERGELVSKEIEEKPLSFSALAEKAKTEAREKRPRDESSSIVIASEAKRSPPSDTGATDPQRSGGISGGPRGGQSPRVSSADEKNDKKSGSLKPGEVIKLPSFDNE